MILPPLPAFHDAEGYCATLGHEAAEPRDDHAAYLASWIKVLRNYSRAIVSAAAQAERAVGFLHGVHPGRTAP